MGGGASRCRKAKQRPRSTASCSTLTDKDVPRSASCPPPAATPATWSTRFPSVLARGPASHRPVPVPLGARPGRPVDHLLSQDAIYIGGGSMRNMLASGAEHGIDEAMRRAWERGVVLAGLSAGAMCWFEGGVSPAAARRSRRGIGLLRGPVRAPRRRPERLPVYEAAVATGHCRRASRQTTAPRRSTTARG